MAPHIPSRTLATLPHDVLYEILGYILSDPSDTKRVSILRVSRTLHDAAGVHLYRVVHAKSLASWKLLFGSPEGLLTVEGGRDLGRHVRELKLGAREVDWQDGRYTPFSTGTLLLPSLSHLLITPPPITAHRPSLLRPIFAQLTPSTLTFLPPTSLTPDLLLPFTTLSTLPNQLGLPYRAWPSLRTVHFQGVLPLGPNPHHGGTRKGLLALSQWTIGTVVISTRDASSSSSVGSSGRNHARPTSEAVGLLETVLVGPMMRVAGGQGQMVVTQRAGEGAYEGWGKVEMRVGRGVEKMFRTRHERWGVAVTAVEERRLMGLIVFVGEDGVERRLVG